MLKKITTNWKSGFTVALVSIPLAISLAIASRVSPVQGIITAIWAGLIASFFGSSNYTIIGPTGALSGIIASVVLTEGIDSIGMLSIISGIFILLAGALHFERYLLFIPSSVIHGFTLGIACIIAYNQINFAFGLRNVPTHPELIQNVTESLKHLHSFSSATVITFIIFFCALLIIRKLLPKIPAAIILSVIGIAFGYLYSTTLNIETLGSRYGDISVTLFKIPSFYYSNNLIGTALIIALIAIIEALLAGKIGDTLTATKHNGSKEIFGLGLANIVSGITGGIPVTASLACSMLNIKSGATYKTSALLSSILIALISLIFLPFFKFIPMAVLAAILVNVAVSMVEREHLNRLYRHDKFNFFLALLVAFITLYKDLMIGILSGAVIALLYFVRKLSHGYYELSSQDQSSKEPLTTNQLHEISLDAHVITYRFKGALTYINAQAHVIRFEQDFPNCTSIILNFREVYFIDIDGIDAIDEIIDIIHANNKIACISNLNPLVENQLLSFSKHAPELKAQQRIFENSSDALHTLNHH